MIYKVIIYGIVYFSVGVVIGWTILPTDPILPIFLIILYFNLLWRLYRQKKNYDLLNNSIYRIEPSL